MALIPAWLGNAPNGSWVKANLTTKDEAIAELDACATSASANSIERVWEAFAGSAWDPVHKRLWVFGGGHAVTTFNAPIAIDVGSAGDRAWHILHYHTRTLRNEDFDNVPNSGPPMRVTADYQFNYQGPPVSAHAYDNNKYLAVADRFITFGGAQSGDGSWWRRYVDENGEPTFDPDTGSVTDAPRTGPFLYDYERRDPSRLGGHAGTAVEPSGCDNSGVQGAEAWSNPDWMDALPAWSSPDRSTVVRVENGRDVIYHSRTSLQRIEIDTSGAVISMNSAGSFLQGHTGMHVAEIIDVGDRRAFVQFTGRHPSSSGLISHLLKYWDITDFPTTYGSQVVNAADVHISSQHYTHADGDRPDWPDGPHASEEGSNPGMAWDTYRRKLVLWNGSKRLYELIPPQTLATTGWELADYVTDPLAADGQFPVNPVVSGRTRFVLGHFHYDRGWDVYLGLEKNSTNLWLFKPQDWSPSAGNDEGRRVWAPSVDRVGDRLWETTLE